MNYNTIKFRFIELFKLIFDINDINNIDYEKLNNIEIEKSKFHIYLINLFKKLIRTYFSNEKYCEEPKIIINSSESLFKNTYIIPITSINSKILRYGNIIHCKDEFKIKEKCILLQFNFHSNNSLNNFKINIFKKQTWLIYGLNGYIGKQLLPYLEKDTDINFINGKSRVDNIEDVENEIIEHKPDRILSLIGRMYGDNIHSINYLEDKSKLYENINDNLYCPLILCLLSQKYNIHLTYFGSACIFSYDDTHTINCDNGFKDIDKCNFYGSNYVTVKGFTDKIMNMFNTTLNLRIRMTMTSDNSPKNLLHKIINFDKIHNNPNSMSILPSLFNIYIDMIKNEYIGTFNFCNKGNITFNEILELYNDIKKKNKTWTIIDDNSRANNYLNIDMLEYLYPDKIIHVKDAIISLIISYKT